MNSINNFSKEDRPYKNGKKCFVIIHVQSELKLLKEENMM